MGKVNRNFKASVFTHLFAEPEKERGLYSAFSPVQLPPDTPVVDRTLTDVLYKDRVNDLAFTVGDTLVCFFEAQNTINENMALRYLIYCGRVYEKLINNEELYNEERLAIPTPEFYVLYTGAGSFPEKKIYRLSDSFAMLPDGTLTLELMVTAYNINPGFNEEIVRKDGNLYGYVSFVAKARRFEKSGMNRAEAVERAVRECINEDILAEYFENNASEVINVLLQEWDWEKYGAARERSAEKREREKWQAVVADQAASIADQAASIADKDVALADQAAEIAALKARIDSLSELSH